MSLGCGIPLRPASRILCTWLRLPILVGAARNGMDFLQSITSGMMTTYLFASHFRNSPPDPRENLASRQDATKRVAEAAAVVASAMTWIEVGVAVAAVIAALVEHQGGKEDVAVAELAWGSGTTRPRLTTARPMRSDIFAVVARPAHWRTGALPAVVAVERTGPVEVAEKGRRHVILVALVTRSRTAQQVRLATPKSRLLVVIDSEKPSAEVFPKQLQDQISAHRGI